MRMAGATADLPNGFKMEVSNFMGAPGLVATLRAPDGSWRDYVIDIQAFGRSILEAEGMS